MDCYRIPKQLLFGELIKTHPRHGPKKRWSDRVVMDVRALGLRKIGSTLLKTDSNSQQFVNRSVYLLMLGRPVLLTDPLYFKVLLVQVDVPLSVLET